MVYHTVNLETYNWDALFKNSHQVGNGAIIPYIPRRTQRGEGFGGVLLSSAFKWLPMLLKSPLGSEVVQAGAKLAKDVQNGSPIIKSLKKRTRQVVKNMVGVGESKIEVEKVPTKKRKRIIGVLEPNQSLASTPAGRSYRLAAL